MRSCFGRLSCVSQNLGGICFQIQLHSVLHLPRKDAFYIPLPCFSSFWDCVVFFYVVTCERLYFSS